MKTRTSTTDPLLIDSVVSPVGGVIGMTFCPGKVQPDGASGPWSRDLDVDLATIENWGATHLVTLVEGKELSELKVTDLPRKAAAKFTWHHLPIPDQSVPNQAWEQEWQSSGPRLRNALKAGQRVVIHCKGGLGRTGTVAARILIELGMEPHVALRAVRVARPKAVENALQESYVLAQKPIPLAASKPYHRIEPERASRFRGCLLAGAAGDALGAPVEFLKADAIVKRFGTAGIQDFTEAYGRVGGITDDTQMTLFTAEGLLRAYAGGHQADRSLATSVVAHALHRWLNTQGRSSRVPVQSLGLLSHYSELHSARAPGNTCLSALAAMTTLSEPRVAVNNSKGCGGVMRSAPVGLLAASLGLGVEAAFDLGCSTSAITHGHPTGYLTGGFLAVLIHDLVLGQRMEVALNTATYQLNTKPDHQETLQAVQFARQLAADEGPSLRNLSRLGEGWTAEEALAIAVYCALTAANLEEGIVLAVNHSGDSDSTGAIAGNLLGALYGVHEIPDRWLEGLELRPLITEMADDLATAPSWNLGRSNDLAYWQDRYPGR